MFIVFVGRFIVVVRNQFMALFQSWIKHSLTKIIPIWSKL